MKLYIILTIIVFVLNIKRFYKNAIEEMDFDGQKNNFLLLVLNFIFIIIGIFTFINNINK